MSPRAAWRLEGLGFRRIYDYAAGKADWGAFGLPLEGTVPSSARVGAFVLEPPTCAPDESLRAAKARVSSGAVDVCFVVNDAGILLGLVGRRALARDEDVAVATVMRPGPMTVRPDLRVGRALERMRRHGLSLLPVTRSDGVLLGTARRADLEAAAARVSERTHRG